MKIVLTSLFIALIGWHQPILAQQLHERPENTTLRIALFAPLHLDSVFKNLPAGPIRKFPRYALPGLDFAQGAQLGLDSFSFPGATIELQIFDSRMPKARLDSTIQTLAISGIDGILAPVRDPELTMLAQFAQQQKIPCWSASYPNDAGITNNPFFAILNPTLKTHCEAIFTYLLQMTDNRDKILLVRQTGTQEDRVAGYLQLINQPDQQRLLNYQTVVLDSNYTDLRFKLDSTRNNRIVVGSLDEAFAERIIRILAPLRKKYNVSVIGMPNWDGFSMFSKNGTSTIRDFPVVYTSPYFNAKNDSVSLWLESVYLEKYKGRPSEHAFKGMEMTLQFARHLLEMRGEPTAQRYTFYSKPNLMPIRKSINGTIDYLENKHVFFLRRINGAMSVQ